MEHLAFQTSEKTDLLDDALAKAQGEFDVAKKDADNPFFKSKYADMASTWNACHRALSKYLVSPTQWPVAGSAPDRVALITRISHKGQWMQSGMEVKAKDMSAQSLGSALTYLRRYMLQAVVMVVPDDDGNAAQRGGDDLPLSEFGEIKPTVKIIQNGYSSPPDIDLAEPFALKSAGITDKQRKLMWALAKEHTWQDKEMKTLIQHRYGVDSSMDLDRYMFDDLLETIKTSTFDAAIKQAPWKT